MTMGVEVDITKQHIDRYVTCNNNEFGLYSFFSAKGVLRLKMSKLPFDRLSYSIATNVTGN